MSEQPDDRSLGAPAPSFQVRIPVEWSDDESVPLVYANQVLVSHSGPEFFIVFGVLLPPTNPSELPDVLRIKPQVRVAVSRDAMPAFVQALNDNLRRYQEALARASQLPPPVGPTPTDS
jgi:hypothetical protein